MTTKRNRVIALLTAVSAMALSLILASPSQANNLGDCRAGVCSASTAYCTDTCSFDGANAGTASCGSVASTCIRCGTRTIEHAQLLGQAVAESYPAQYWLSRTEFFCTNGQTTTLSTKCVKEDLNRCPATVTGPPMTPENCCRYTFGRNCWGQSSC
jgi:hypothetical protein